jgi:putative ABC transport system permease protein
MGRMAIETFASLGFQTAYIFPTQGVILAIASGLFFGALAAILPARQAARLQIVEALRYE